MTRINIPGWILYILIVQIEGRNSGSLFNSKRHVTVSCVQPYTTKPLCDVGHFLCHEGFGCGEVDKCVRCPSGSFMDNLNSCAKCSPCSKCTGRQEEDKPCTPKTDRVCVCKEGFMPHPNRSDICVKDVYGTYRAPRYRGKPDQINSTRPKESDTHRPFVRRIPTIAPTLSTFSSAVSQSERVSSMLETGYVYLHLPIWVIAVMVIVIVAMIGVVIAVVVVCVRGRDRRPAAVENYSNQPVIHSLGQRSGGSGSSRSYSSGHHYDTVPNNSSESRMNGVEHPTREVDRNPCQNTDLEVPSERGSLLQAQPISNDLSLPPTLDLKEDPPEFN